MALFNFIGFISIKDLGFTILFNYKGVFIIANITIIAIDQNLEVAIFSLDFLLFERFRAGIDFPAKNDNFILYIIMLRNKPLNSYYLAAIMISFFKVLNNFIDLLRIEDFFHYFFIQFFIVIII